MLFRSLLTLHLCLQYSTGFVVRHKNPLKVSTNFHSGSFRPTTQRSALPFDNQDIASAFNVANFGPQPFWLLMILAPNAGFTKKTMEPLPVIITFSLCHLFIVLASISQDSGTAPIAEFNDVFDPSGNPQAAMVNMMRYPNFVSEEWSHVLTWDLFVGRWIWMDGLKRGIFTPHSVLLTNLIGPPGLLLHFLTCTILGKGLPPSEITQPDDKS